MTRFQGKNVTLWQSRLERLGIKRHVAHILLGAASNRKHEQNTQQMFTRSSPEGGSPKAERKPGAAGLGGSFSGLTLWRQGKGRALGCCGFPAGFSSVLPVFAERRSAPRAPAKGCGALDLGSCHVCGNKSPSPGETRLVQRVWVGPEIVCSRPVGVEPCRWPASGPRGGKPTAPGSPCLRRA